MQSNQIPEEKNQKYLVKNINDYHNINNDDDDDDDFSPFYFLKFRQV